MPIPTVEAAKARIQRIVKKVYRLLLIGEDDPSRVALAIASDNIKRGRWRVRIEELIQRFPRPVASRPLRLKEEVSSAEEAKR
jgi:hypothetical protein